MAPPSLRGRSAAPALARALPGGGWPRAPPSIETTPASSLAVRAGVFKPRPGQNLGKSLPIIERALIRYFLSEGHDLVNIAGTQLRRHDITSGGRHPNLFIPKLMFVDRSKGE